MPDGTWTNTEDGADFPFRHEAPPIPDHEVLRCIGKGAYGEVWMAQGLTGALRAVKVVHREDFELQRTFEREFEGLKYFEPIARKSTGLVDILHVGSSTEPNFYFYVMELADDVESGREVTPAEYEPRTLRSEMRKHGHLPLGKCVEFAVGLTVGLQSLHEHGLAHRDIKPSNVIFVNGEPMLADIGLVAESGGERMYVGTDGFVPPEGPGTEQADIYSLGMVLYELVTGNDRLQFPELPDHFDLASSRDQWLAINEVICKACAPNPKKRYQTAAEMAADLREIGTGDYKPGRFPTALAVPAAAAVAAGLISVWKSEGKAHLIQGPVAEVAIAEQAKPVLQTLMAPALIVINSNPVGADIFFGNRKLGKTPLDWENDPGEYEVVLKKEGFKDHPVKIDLKPNRNKEISAELAVWMPPVDGKRWVNSKGMAFTPVEDEWVSDWPVAYKDFEEFGFLEGEPVPWTPQKGNDKRQQFVVYVPRWDAQSYCEWLTQQDQRAGYLPEDFRYRVEEFSDEKLEKRIITRQPDFTAFRAVAFRQKLGRLVIKTDPPGAEVFRAGERIGVTPLTYPRAPAVQTRIDLRLPGYTYMPLVVDVKVNEETKIDVKLEESNSVVFGKRWQNPIGMVFEPLEGVEGVMMSVYETRRREFDRFVKENGREPTHVPGFAQGGDHPAVLVSRDDAEAFCRWLTERDRRQEKIGADDVYRLPYDQEWSMAVGTLRERGATPAERGSRTLNIFPWGPEWPPPGKSGNYADARYRSKARDSKGDIADYNDSEVYTSPVGRYRAKGSFFDLSGNVWEWVADDYGGADLELGALGVLRGGSWRSFEQEDLSRGRRRAELPEVRVDTIGFRCVLAKVDVEPDAPPTMPFEDDD